MKKTFRQFKDNGKPYGSSIEADDWPSGDEEEFDAFIDDLSDDELDSFEDEMDAINQEEDEDDDPVGDGEVEEKVDLSKVPSFKKKKIKRSDKRKRKMEYKRNKAKIKLKMKRFKRTNTFKKWKRKSKFMAKRGKTAKGKWKQHKQMV